ncbi:hypothetical protein PAMP_024511 [Pampus punctatissimus]
MAEQDTATDTSDSDSAKMKTVPPTEGPSHPGEDNQGNVEKNNTPLDDGSRGDSRGSPKNEQPTNKNDTRQENNEPKVSTVNTLDDTENDNEIPVVDDSDETGDENIHNKEDAVMNEECDDRALKSEDEAGGPEMEDKDGHMTSSSIDMAQDLDADDVKEETDDGSGSEKENGAEQDNRTLQQTQLPEEISKENELAEQRKITLETIGPTTQGTTKHSVPEFNGIYGGNRIYWIAFFLVGLLALLVLHLEPESPPQKNLQQIDIFLSRIEKVKSQFANQRPELWKRSRIHLERHLNTTQPKEPVSLILTAGLRAERTLHCLAQGLASTFSSALNASVLHIDGASKASQDSDQVKLDIDSQLQGAFEGDKPVAVIHRFEELPPGSTLIFYRYCDHENAAYKKTFLIFTVLLGEEEEIPSKIPLSTVEEMVDDHLRKKFLSHGHPVAFDRMDLDKYGGLWSRISHLILPVAAEKRMEHEGC